MRYEEFKEKVKNVPLISVQYLKLVTGNNQLIKNQLTRWQKAKKVVRLKRNLYILDDNNRKINPSRLFIAFEMYKPSYVSMEYALSFYGIIPEKVTDLTSITPKKTAVFENVYGKFIYQHIKINCFTGFEEQKDESGLSYYMATPEKAVVDYIYLNQSNIKGDFKQILFESLRFQNTNILSQKKMNDYANLYSNQKLKLILKQVKQ